MTRIYVLIAVFAATNILMFSSNACSQQLTSGEIIVEKINDNGRNWDIIVDKSNNSCIARYYVNNYFYMSLYKKNNSYYIEFFYNEWEDEKGSEVIKGLIIYPEPLVSFVFKDGSTTLGHFTRKHKTLVATIYDGNSTHQLDKLPSRDRIFRGEPFTLRYVVQNKPLLGGWTYIPYQAFSRIEALCEE